MTVTSAKDKADGKSGGRSGGESGGKAKVTAAQVADYLRAHPRFLMTHPDVVRALNPPARYQDEDVADLQHLLVRRLTEEVEGLRDKKRALVAAARENAAVGAQVRQAILAVLECDGLEELGRVVREDLPLLLDLAGAALALEPRAAGGALPEPISALPEGGASVLLGSAKTRLSDRVTADPSLFGPKAGQVGSQALARLDLGPETPPGVLALGAASETAYRPDQGTELLVFLAQVIETRARAWLGLAHPPGPSEPA